MKQKSPLKNLIFHGGIGRVMEVRIPQGGGGGGGGEIDGLVMEDE